MANILLTNHCVRSCPYCFAKRHMEGSVPDDTIQWDDLVYIADFFAASKERHIALLGGEPTLHPDFVDIVRYFVERKFHVNVFTSAVMSDRQLQEAQTVFSRMSPKDLSFVVNLNDPKKTSFAELQSIHRFLKAFPQFTALGYNIYQEKFDMTFLFEYILRFGLKPVVRLGLAHRIPGMKNTHIPTSNLRNMIDTLMTYMPTYERLGIRPGFDCGVPLCQFTDDEVGKLWKVMGNRFKFGCGPAIDIGPDMNVWTCFPLSGYQKKSLYEFNSVRELSQFYKGFQDSVRKEIGGIYEECDTCAYRESEQCMGGCVAHSLHAFLDEAKVRPEEVYL